MVLQICKNLITNPQKSVLPPYPSFLPLCKTIPGAKDLLRENEARRYTQPTSDSSNSNRAISLPASRSRA